MVRFSQVITLQMLVTKQWTERRHMKVLNKTMSATIIVMLISMSGVACAEDSPAYPAKIDQALKVAMVPELLEAQSREMQAQVSQDPRMASMTPEQRAQFTKMLNAAFDTKAQYADAAQFIADEFNEEDLDAFIKAYSKPVAKKLNAMMIDAYTDDYKAKLQEYANGLDKNPPAKQRIQMLARLDDLTGSSANNAEVSLEMMGRMSGITSKDPRYESLKAKISQSAREQSILSYLYTLQKASDDEINSFVALHDDPAVSRSATLVGKALAKSMQGSFTRMMEHAVNMSSHNDAGSDQKSSDSGNTPSKQPQQK